MILPTSTTHLLISTGKMCYRKDDRTIRFTCGCPENFRAIAVFTASRLAMEFKVAHNKKLSYCWETVRHESMLRIAEMDVEMTT